MGHEWKIGDWAEPPCGSRFLVWKTDGEYAYGISSTSHWSWLLVDERVKHLPECTGWEWEPPKPVEPTARKWKFGDWAKTRQRNIVRFVSVDDDGDYMCVGRDGDVSAFTAASIVYLPDCTGFDWTPPSPVKQIEPPSGYRLLGRDETVDEGDLCIEVPGMSSHPSWRAAGGKSIGCTAGFRIDSYGIAAYARKIEPSYSERQAAWMKEHDVKVGDKVKVLRTFETNEQQCGLTWDERMSSLIGRTITLQAIGSNCLVSDGFTSGLFVPHFVLEKIEPRYRPFANAAEFEPFAEKWICRSEMGVIKPGAWKVIGYSDKGIYSDSSVMLYADAFDMLQFKDGTRFGVLDTKE